MAADPPPQRRRFSGPARLPSASPEASDSTTGGRSNAGPKGNGQKPDDAAWYVDPFGRYEKRWWDGDRWSEKVRDGKDLPALDPPGIDPHPVGVSLDEPASPIQDAHLPIKPPPVSGQLTFALGLVVFVALVVLIVLYLFGVV